MNTDITINDGTTSRTYKSSFGGSYRPKPNVVEHLRKTDEFDNTPETLLMRGTVDGNVNRHSVTLTKVKVDEATGRKYKMTTTRTHVVEVGVFTLAESSSQIKELAAFDAVTANAEDSSKAAV